MIQAQIQYTCPAPPGEVNGVFVGKSQKFALNPTTFSEQHGFVPCSKKREKLYNDLVYVDVPVLDAREKGFKLMKNGFELVRAPFGPLNDLKAYMAHLERVAKDASGASHAKAFAYTSRNWRPSEFKVNAVGFGQYVHSDVGPHSWATKLETIPVEQLPPGLSPQDKTRALAGMRYAVVTAWRYLGPDKESRKSHLAILDHSTLRPQDDVIQFELQGDDTFGSNYRLRTPPPEMRCAHRYFYYPRMKADDEALFFLAFDSGPNDFLHTPTPSVMHSAFVDPNIGTQQNDRQSVDVRLLLVWD